MSGTDYAALKEEAEKLRSLPPLPRPEEILTLGKTYNVQKVTTAEEGFVRATGDDIASEPWFCSPVGHLQSLQTHLGADR